MRMDLYKGSGELRRRFSRSWDPLCVKVFKAGRDDPVTKQKMGQEMQELYRKENVSMAGGCLPLLIQMPILIALYRIVIDPLRYVLGQVPALSSALATYATTARAAGGLGLSINASNGTIGLLSNLGSEHLEGLGNFMFFNNGQSVAERVESIIDKIPDFTLGNVNLGANPGFDGPQHPHCSKPISSKI